MKPSFLSTSSTLTRSREPGVETLGFLRICALVIRAIRSPSGSFNCISILLPARLDQARYQALGAELAQRDPAELVLAVEAARPAGHLTTVADAGGRRVARQLGKFQRGGKPFLHRLFLVVRNRLQPCPAAGKLLRHPASPVVLFDHALLSHRVLL